MVLLSKISRVLGASITKNYYLAALIGVLATFASIMPSAIALRRNDSHDLYKYIEMENKVWKMPLFYAGLNAFAFYIVNTFFPKNLKRYWMIGILLGLVYPTLGTIGDYAKKAYGIKSYYALYASAQVMYGLFYGVVIATIVYLIKL